MPESVVNIQFTVLEIPYPLLWSLFFTLQVARSTTKPFTEFGLIERESTLALQNLHST